MEPPLDLPSTLDKLNKKPWHLKALLSRFNEALARNNSQVCPEPCYYFKVTSFLSPDLEHPSFSNFDPLKIITLFTEKKQDQPFESGGINALASFSKVAQQRDKHGHVQEVLAKLVVEKKLDLLVQSGGVKGLASSLQTNLQYGIQADAEEISSRKQVFGTNTYPVQPRKSFFSFLFDAFKDVTILILLACAAISVGLGMKKHGPREGWYEGGSIFMALSVIISVPAISGFWQAGKLYKSYEITNNFQAEVVRSGVRQKISVFEIVVGDVVCLKIGDQVPADGLLLDGQGLLIDESCMTGESDLVDVDLTRNPFLLSGTRVADGYGGMLVTSVGLNTEWGLLMSSIRPNLSEETPLQARVNKLASSSGNVGLVVAFLVLVVLLVRYFTGNTEDKNGNKEYGSNTKGDDIIIAVAGMIAVAITIVVIAIPEGLFIAVTVTLAYSMKKMMADHAMVRKLTACETMGSATTICTDKTGPITMNNMRVTKFWVGQEPVEVINNCCIAANVLELLHQGVGLNTSGSVYKLTPELAFEFSGSPTEKALLSWAVQELNMDMEKLKQSCTLLHQETFSSERKRSCVLVKKNADNSIQVHSKGAAEMVLAMCSHYYNRSGEVKALDDSERKKFELLIQGMAASSLRCIAFAHKRVSEFTLDVGESSKKIEDSGLTLLGLVGLKDPCRPGVKKAVEDCQYAGVNIKMITGDNVFTARAIATECGILKPTQDGENGRVVEGVEFRNYTHEERMDKVDRICVMARSSPPDKLLMVQCLQAKGHVVAVTGDGINDAPALHQADVGLSMGLQGTEVAKESSDIVILDDNFASVATVLRWGRSVYINIQNFIQFQLTVNVAALVINLVASISTGEVPLTVAQLLWINLIMDSLGALALATAKPTNELMKRSPVDRTESLISNIMWRNLIAQACYQLAVILTLQFKGEEIFGVNEKVRNTLIFNTFVLCQVFNLFNSRELEKKNVFKGLLRNKLFVGIVGLTLTIQVMMIEFLKKFENIERLNWGQWGVCIEIAAVSWPLGCLVKFIPVPKQPFFNFFKFRS